MDEEQLRIVAAIISNIVRKYHENDRDDTAQELWIEAIRAHELFDGSRGVEFRKYMANILGMRRADIFRRCSAHKRSGQIRFTRTFFSELTCDPEAKKDFNRHVVDPYSTDGIETTDWADLGRRVANETQEVQALYLYCSGETMRVVGERLELSESRVSQILSSQGQASAERLRHLMFDKNYVRKQELQVDQNTPLPGHSQADPVEVMLRIVERCDDATIQSIDRKIEEHHNAISQLKRLRSVLGKAGKRKLPAVRNAGPRLGDQLAAMLDKQESIHVDDAAKHFGCKPQSIRMAVTKSNQLRMVGNEIRKAG